MDLLENINARGTTIIMVTHDTSLATRAQRNIHILDGRISDITTDTQLNPSASISHLANLPNVDSRMSATEDY